MLLRKKKALHFYVTRTKNIIRVLVIKLTKKTDSQNQPYNRSQPGYACVYCVVLTSFHWSIKAIGMLCFPLLFSFKILQNQSFLLSHCINSPSASFSYLWHSSPHRVLWVLKIAFFICFAFWYYLISYWFSSDTPLVPLDRDSLSETAFVHKFKDVDT